MRQAGSSGTASAACCSSSAALRTTAQTRSRPGLRRAAGAQANKNLLIKARAGTADVALAAAFKAWWQPSLCAAVNAAWDFASQQPRLGLALNVENYGNIRCARTGASTRGSEGRS